MTATVERPAMQSSPTRSHRPVLPAWLLGVAVLLLAFGIRLWNLAGPSIWYDEAVTLQLASRPPAEIVTRTMNDTLPPLSYLVLHAWLTVGSGEWLWRFPSVCFGVLTVALLLRLGYVMGGRTVGLLAGSAVTLSPFFVAYSQEVRLYAMLGALLTGYLLFSVQTPTIRTSLVAGLLGAAALYSHQLAGLIILLPPLLEAARTRRLDWPRFLPPIIAVALFAPWLTVTVSQGRRVMSSFWAEPVSPLRPLASLVVFAFGSPTGTVSLALGSTVVLLLVGLAVLRASHHGPPQRTWYWLAITLVPPFALTLLSLVRPIYLDRVLIGSGVAWLLLSAVLLRTLDRPVRLLMAIAWLATASFGLFLSLLAPDLGKPELRQAAALVASQAQASDIVVHTGDGSFQPFLLYAPQLDNVLLAGDPEYEAGSPRGNWTERVMEYETVPLGPVLASGRRVWVVALLDHSVDWQIDQARTIDARLDRLLDERFHGVTVRAYAPAGSHDR